MTANRQRQGTGKTLNDYVTGFDRDLYRDTPKAVWAAIAISALTNGGDHLGEAERRVVDEWRALHTARVIPQQPPKGAK